VSYSLPRATGRCWGCGVASGPCQCTPEFAMWERAQEGAEEWPETPFRGVLRPSEDGLSLEERDAEDLPY
jgi:hypothetical protein